MLEGVWYNDSLLSFARYDWDTTYSGDTYGC